MGTILSPFSSFFKDKLFRATVAPFVVLRWAPGRMGGSAGGDWGRALPVLPASQYLGQTSGWWQTRECLGQLGRAARDRCRGGGAGGGASFPVPVSSRTGRGDAGHAGAGPAFLQLALLAHVTAAGTCGSPGPASCAPCGPWSVRSPGEGSRAGRGGGRGVTAVHMSPPPRLGAGASLCRAGGAAGRGRSAQCPAPGTPRAPGSST